MKRNQWFVAFAVVLALSLAVVLAVGLSVASSANGPLYVSATDATCGGRIPCYTTIQAAVNAAADGDEVRVATGTYTGTAPALVSGNIYTQVVVITKSLTLRGGYSTTDWDVSDPKRNPAVIDAQRLGRAISIVGTGSQTVTVEAFTITGGDYSGMGNPSGVGNQVCGRTGSDCGGGLFAWRVALVLRDMIIRDNIASRTRVYSDGGGLYLWLLRAGSRIENTALISNSTQASLGEGGGAYVYYGRDLVIAQSLFQDNRAQGEGGGLFILQPDDAVLIERTVFVSNTSVAASGGALAAYLVYPGKALSLSRVVMEANQARSQAAACELLKQGSGVSQVDLTNVLLAGNRLSLPFANAGVLSAIAEYSRLELHAAHVTIAKNEAPGAVWVETTAPGRWVTATLTNTLIVSATAAFVGQQTGDGVLIHHTNTLAWNVTTQHVIGTGSPTFEAIHPVAGDPLLDADYHLQSGSAAIDTGVNAGVRVDIDGDPRPIGAGYDVGADEYGFPVYLPIVVKAWVQSLTLPY
jgi:hypothetical protein